MTEPAAPVPTLPASAAPDPVAPAPGPTRSRGVRIGRRAAQAFAIVGLVVCVALAVIVFVIGANLSGSIDRALATGDAAFARAVETADQATDNLQTAAGALDALVTTIGESTADSPLPAAIAARVADASERYLDIRDGYVAVRDRVQAAVARAQAIDELLPFIDLPDEPAGPLAALDDRLGAFDAALSSLRTSDVAAAAAAEIQTAVTGVQTAVSEVADVAEGVRDGVVSVRAEVDAAGSTIQMILWIATLAIVVLLAYIAALHLAVFWLIRR